MKYIFKRMEFKDELIHHISDNDVLLSFYDDDGAYKFNDWWYEEGSELFLKWLVDNDYTHLLDRVDK
jgi:hypothetical protein